MLLFTHMINVPLMLPGVFHKKSHNKPGTLFSNNKHKETHSIPDWCIGKIKALYANAILGAVSLLVMNKIIRILVFWLFALGWGFQSKWINIYIRALLLKNG